MEHTRQRCRLQVVEFFDVLRGGTLSLLVIIIQLLAELATPPAGVSGLVPLFTEVFRNKRPVDFKREDDDALPQGAERQGNGSDYGKGRSHEPQDEKQQNGLNSRRRSER